jgi:hypothetical protein
MITGELPFELDDKGMTESWMILKKIKRGIPKINWKGVSTQI